jgi:hypothetical protein
MAYTLLAEAGIFAWCGDASYLTVTLAGIVAPKDWHLFWLDLAHSHSMIAVSASRLNYLHP